jgi:hypothetical protein
MQGPNKERWKVLCEQAAVEQDPKKLHELIREINERAACMRLPTSKYSSWNLLNFLCRLDRIVAKSRRAKIVLSCRFPPPGGLDD